jgi:hypothetical protein
MSVEIKLRGGGAQSFEEYCRLRGKRLVTKPLDPKQRKEIDVPAAVTHRQLWQRYPKVYQRRKIVRRWGSGPKSYMFVELDCGCQLAWDHAVEYGPCKDEQHRAARKRRQKAAKGSRSPSLRRQA